MRSSLGDLRRDGVSPGARTVVKVTARAVLGVAVVAGALSWHTRGQLARSHVLLPKVRFPKPSTKGAFTTSALRI
jgi:hypothetical protein